MLDRVDALTTDDADRPGRSDQAGSGPASATATLTDSIDDDHPEPQRGETIGRYLVLERIGAGGMGVVFAAYDPELDRRVAIKVLHGRRDSDAARRRLAREAQALARIAHPHVVAVHDVGLHDGRVFLAMEYVEGGTLREFMADPAHDLDARRRVLIAAGEGLAAAHRAGLVHRDFKPDNVMVGERGEVKVMDFGLARSHADASEHGSTGPISRGAMHDSDSSRLGSPRELLTEAGVLLGTPAYMAPEQLAGEVADARSDQFAFAVTAHELLYGVRPFVGANLSALTLAIAEGRLVDPPKQHQVPPRLRRVILRGLALEPAARWPDLDAMIRALAHDPARSRRRLAGMGAALLLSALLGGAVVSKLVRPSAPAPACTHLEKDLDGSWTASERGRVERALQRASTAESAQTVLRSLDSYAAAWDAAQLDNCTRTTIEQVQSDAVHELRAGCLRHRKAAFEQLVALMAAEPDPSVPARLDRAVEAAARLPDVDACADVDALALTPALPTDPQLRATVEDLRDELAGLQSRVELSPSVERAREVAARADASADPAIAAEAALVLGRTLAAVDDLPASVIQLRRSYFLAMSCGHARTQAEAATALVFVVGYRQQDHAHGQEWAEHALAIVERFAGTLVEADAVHALGVLRDAAGDPLGSLAAYREAYELRQQLLPSVHPDIARSLHALANVHTNLGEYELARDHQQRALQMRLELFGPDHVVIAGSLNNLALSMRRLGELDEAKQMLERAVAIHESSSGSNRDGLARALTNLADVERLRHDHARARALEERSLAVRRATVGDQHPEVADSMLGLARIARDEGQLEQAEAFARDALARLRRDFAPGHPETFAATVVLASILELRGHRDEAARVLVSALADSSVENLDADDLADARALLDRLGAQSTSQPTTQPKK
jgi:serine/threonine protein kinase/tetratricopeptide (TPR) repeat protein